VVFSRGGHVQKKSKSFEHKTNILYKIYSHLISNHSKCQIFLSKLWVFLSRRIIEKLHKG
jgi:hypothetical protein